MHALSDGVEGSQVGVDGAHMPQVGRHRGVVVVAPAQLRVDRLRGDRLRSLRGRPGGRRRLAGRQRQRWRRTTLRGWALASPLRPAPGESGKLSGREGGLVGVGEDVLAAHVVDGVHVEVDEGYDEAGHVPRSALHLDGILLLHFFVLGLVILFSFVDVSDEGGRHGRLTRNFHLLPLRTGMHPRRLS